MDNSHPTNRLIRQILCEQRRRLGDDVVKKASHQISEKILNSDIFKRSTHIALYMPFDNEVSPLALLNQQNKHYYLPCLIEGQRSLCFLTYRGKLVEHPYGLQQPPFVDKDVIGKTDLDLMLVPVVAFNHHGDRLGRGQGYYDRYLHSRHDEQQPYCIGIGYEFQRNDEFAVRPWDVRMHMIITEKTTYP